MFLDPIKHVLRAFFNSFKDPCLFRDFSKRDMKSLNVNYIQTGKVLLVRLLLKFRKLFLEMPAQTHVSRTKKCEGTERLLG